MQAEINVVKMGSNAVDAHSIVFPFNQNIETTILGNSNYFNFLAPVLMIMIVMIKL